MTTWGLPMSCLYCGGPLLYLNGTGSGTLAVTVVACDPCNRQYEVTTRLTQIPWTQEEAKARRAVAA